ncbi:MAG TPA: bile acid:sodium symporter family protein [Robiginitalea sp.]|nr:bile acid:sodium symporter family protein [Robiginitalea sp.]
MKARPATQLAITITLLLLAYVAWLGFSGQIASAGWPLFAFFCCMAGAFASHPSLKNYVFTCMIFAGVTLAMYYPEAFLQVGDFRLAALIIPLIQVIMFGMGTSMSPRDFAAVFRQPRAVGAGLFAQLSIMPLVGYFLATVSGLPPEIAAGIVLVGCSPSGVASNVMAYLARANLALSITITSIATLLSPFITPLGMRLLAGALIELDPWQMMWDIVKMILIPIGAGLLFNRWMGSGARKLSRFMPLLSMAAIGVIIVIITAAGRDSLLQIGGTLLMLVLAHNAIGYVLGYGFARMLRLSEQDARTISLEVGMQNSGLASGLAYSLGKIATMGLAPAVFGPLMNISGSLLASFWHRRSPEEPAAGLERPRHE